MVNFKKFFLFIFLLFKVVFNQNGIITLPFKKEIPDLNGVKPEEFIFPKMATNLIMAELKIGSSPQTMKLRLEFESYLFYIASQSSLSDIKFNQKESKTYQIIEDKTIKFEISKLNKAIYSSDYIYYNNDKKYNTTFLLGIDTDEDKSGGLIGLNMDDEKEVKKFSKYNFINELKRINVINDYYFSIKYTSKKSGNIIIGDLPHNFNKNYNKEDYRDTYADFSENDLTWKLKLDKIYIADENSEEKTDVELFGYGYFRIEKNIIEGTEKYRQVLLKTFMSELINKELCFELKTNIYYSYYCKKEVDISKMKNIYFYNKKLDYTFELTYKDVFYYNEYDHYHYLLIVFSSDIDEEESGYNEFWILGEPIFKKYQFIFNKNSKRIGLYTKIDNENNNKKSSFFSKNKWYIFLIILLIILCCIVGVLFYLFLKRKPKRKIKANELDDEFDYSAQSNKLVED